MFRPQTNVIHGEFRQGQRERYNRERVKPASGNFFEAAIKDGNEANFDTVNGRGHCWLCRDHQDRSETGKKGLHINCSGLSSSWDQCYTSAVNSCGAKGYRVIAKSGDNSEEPGDYPFGLNPAGYTSRSMIVICK